MYFFVHLFFFFKYHLQQNSGKNTEQIKIVKKIKPKKLKYITKYNLYKWLQQLATLFLFFSSYLFVFLILFSLTFVYTPSIEPYLSRSRT